MKRWASAAAGLLLLLLPAVAVAIDGGPAAAGLAQDQRERANFATRDPKRLAAMRARYLAREEALPKHPDATYSVPATQADLVTPSS